MRTEETFDVISAVLGSPVSNDTPLGSSPTSKAKTLSELHALTRFGLESPKVTAKIASNPPAPGTPASKTPSMSMVASKSRVCDSGSICKPKKQAIFNLMKKHELSIKSEVYLFFHGEECKISNYEFSKET